MENNFCDGVHINSVTTKYGDIIKVGINIDKFTTSNDMNDKGFINFEIKKSKSGKYYAELPQKQEKPF